MNIRRIGCDMSSVRHNAGFSEKVIGDYCNPSLRGALGIRCSSGSACRPTDRGRQEHEEGEGMYEATTRKGFGTKVLSSMSISGLENNEEG
jgi:hypothetical protein